MDEEPRIAEYEAIVIGTGFGGAVTACRLVEAGVRTLVLERGRRYTSNPVGPRQEPSSPLPRLPATDRVLPDAHRWSYTRDQGLWDVACLGGVTSLQGAGLGGGSLVYANVHLRPPKSVFAGWPGGYTAELLKPFYDRVAAMLDIKPITEAPFHPLVKTDQMAKVARELGREADFFHPPLAVSFEETPDNGFGRSQSACRACGECDTGCRYRAKNTLDLNYLAVVEDSDHATVRTQAEVVMISKVAEHRYEVVYVDHMRGNETVRVRSSWVFLCAGAIRSTELLLRAKEAALQKTAYDAGQRLCPPPYGPGLPELDRHDNLGKRYHANADAIGMVYDTQVAQDVPRETHPTVGPVITTAMSHWIDDRSWFLLEEGGFPEALARHAGIMRAPLWLRRNRHDRDGEGPRRNRHDRDGEGPRRIRCVDPSPAPPNLPVVPPPATLAGVGGLADGPHVSVPDAVYRLLVHGDLDGAVPEQAKEAARALVKELDRLEQHEARELSVDVRDRLGPIVADAAVDERHVWGRLVARFRLRRAVWAFVLWFYRLFANRIKPPQLEAAAIGAFEARYPIRRPLELAARATKELTAFHDDGGAHSKRTMVLLGMGLDPTPGRLELREGALSCKLHIKPGAAVFTREETLMRDVAAALGGKLRVNPLWSFARSPVTVHSQGGCAMSNTETEGVTDDHGQVHGHPGLVVLDGSILPSAVGVNPASTIAAVAERNVDHHLGVMGRRPAGRPELEARVAAWQKRQAQGAWVLEPPPPRRKRTVSEPIGIQFCEWMRGFVSAADQALLPKPSARPEYERLEHAGRRSRTFVDLTLRACIPDVAEFVRDPRHGVNLIGGATVAGVARNHVVPIMGTLELLTGHGEMRLMQYELHGDVEGERLTIRGVKWLLDEPGPDAVWDTTALFTDVRVGDDERLSGIAHVATDEFAFEQLPSFKVTGTKDPARQLWALSTFGAYFFGSLQGVYAPELQRAIDALSKLGVR